MSGDPLGWFEPLYSAAARGDAQVPWEREEPRELLVEWAEAAGLDGGGRPALVVGAGFGADAEYLSARGFATTAFDIAPTAVRLARERHPGSSVDYVVADLLAPPATWAGAFALVLDCLTVQSLPDDLRPAAIANLAPLVAPGGTLLVIASARDAADGPVHGPPWPLTRAEVESFATGEVEAVRIEEREGPRWRAEFRRAQ